MKLELNYTFSSITGCTFFLYNLCLVSLTVENLEIFWCTLLVKPFFGKQQFQPLHIAWLVISLYQYGICLTIESCVVICKNNGFSLSLSSFRIWQFGSGRFAFQVWYLFALIFHLLFVVYSYEQRIRRAIFLYGFL